MTEPSFAPQPQYLPPPWRGFWQRFKWLIIASVVVVVLCCGGGAAFLVYGGLEINAVREAGTAYLSDAEAGEFDKAYEHLCAKAQAETSPAGLSQLPKIVSFLITAATVRSGLPAGTSGSFTARLVLGDGRRVVQTFPVIKEHGQWKVCD